MRRPDIVEIRAALGQKSPLALLIWLQMAMVLSFATWQVLIQNFAHNAAGFDGQQYGLLQSLRELPGFLAFLVVFVILVIREQWLAYLSLILLGVATAITGLLPSFYGLMFTTLLSSIGFHYYETVNQSLQLQWLDKADAPRQIGLIMAAGSAMSFVIYALIAFLWKPLGLSFSMVYIPAGFGTVLMVVYAMRKYAHYPDDAHRNRGIILRRRYWLFYLLQFFSGARRQIFVVFAGFMMVERFGFSVGAMSALALLTFVMSTFLAPLVGRMVQAIGERNTLLIEYAGLIFVFGSYTMLVIWDWPAPIAVALYLIDHVFFAMMIAMKTYFQKIADRGDISGTAAVSFTINHIAAVVLPALLGLIWLASPAYVFGFATMIAFASFCAAMLVPRHPEIGRETVLA